MTSPVIRVLLAESVVRAAERAHRAAKRALFWGYASATLCAVAAAFNLALLVTDRDAPVWAQTIWLFLVVLNGGLIYYQAAYGVPKAHSMVVRGSSLVSEARDDLAAARASAGGVR